MHPLAVKIPHQSLSLAILVLSCIPAPAEYTGYGTAGEAAGGGYTESMTEEAFQKLRSSRPAAASNTPAEALRPYDIVDASDFIVFDGNTTLVPKGAIINLPEAYRNQVVANPAGQLLVWNEFLNLNRARIVPFEVSLEEAAGAKVIDPKRLETAVRSGMIVVAAMNGNPTSVAIAPSPANDAAGASR